MLLRSGSSQKKIILAGRAVEIKLGKPAPSLSPPFPLLRAQVEIGTSRIGAALSLSLPQSRQDNLFLNLPFLDH